MQELEKPRRELEQRLLQDLLDAAPEARAHAAHELMARDLVAARTAIAALVVKPFREVGDELDTAQRGAPAAGADAAAGAARRRLPRGNARGLPRPCLRRRAQRRGAVPAPGEPVLPPPAHRADRRRQPQERRRPSRPAPRPQARAVAGRAARAVARAPGHASACASTSVASEIGRRGGRGPNSASPGSGARAATRCAQMRPWHGP
jgi:hypothetical protein